MELPERAGPKSGRSRSPPSTSRARLPCCGTRRAAPSRHRGARLSVARPRANDTRSIGDRGCLRRVPFAERQPCRRPRTRPAAKGRRRPPGWPPGGMATDQGSACSSLAERAIEQGDGTSRGGCGGDSHVPKRLGHSTELPGLHSCQASLRRGRRRVQKGRRAWQERMARFHLSLAFTTMASVQLNWPGRSAR